MQSRGNGKSLDFDHNISNCPQMIAKFSNVNMAAVEDDPEDSDNDQEFAEFYDQSLWLGHTDVETPPAINNIVTNLSTAIAYAPITRPYLSFDNENDNYGEEPNFPNPEEYIDDIDDEELTPKISKQKPRESDSAHWAKLRDHEVITNFPN